MMERVANLTDHELTKILTYAGYILLSYELTRSMIVDPIRLFYTDVKFHGGPFKSYEEDVLMRNKKSEFEACLLYLKDFMEAIDDNDLRTIQALRKHRNNLAHELPDRLNMHEINNNSALLDKVKDVIFKLSNYRAYIEIGQERELKGVDWSSVKGHEYLLLETIISKVQTLK
jgi:hypothetical protein